MELPKEAFLYWIHCNRCFELYTRKIRKMYLLSCKHISCEKCTSKAEDKNDTYNCPTCKNIVQGRLLGNTLPPHMKELFHPQPWLPDLPHARILRFQQPHRTHFEMGMQRMVRELERLQQNTEQLRAGAKKKFERLENLRYERRQLEKRVRIMNKRRKEKEEERLRREAELENQVSSSISSIDRGVTVDSGISMIQPVLRHRIASQGVTIRPRATFNGTTPRLPNPHNLSFRSFAYPNTVDFTL